MGTMGRRPASLGASGFLQSPLRTTSAPSADVIDKSSYFADAVKHIDAKNKPYRSASSDDVMSGGKGSNKHCWSPARLRPVPAFYPLERSSRFVQDDLATVVDRVVEANRLLSVHAVYCNETPTASLFTSENVEMHLSLWKPTAAATATTAGTENGGLVVEIQRRKGDSIAFHRYSRCILDAAAGELDIQELVEDNGEDVLDAICNYSKKKAATNRLPVGIGAQPKDAEVETENAIVALEIAHGLLMKDRMDARQLGLESLCLLTDPEKTGLVTASIASRVVLLGTARDIVDVDGDGAALLCDEAPFQEIRQTLFSLIQFRRIGNTDEFDNESLEDSEEEEHIAVLHNLALGVLANSLDVIEKEESSSPSPEETGGLRPRLEAFESISEKFLQDARECSENREMMKTLIGELGKAGSKPHNAHLSAKCIGSLCRASEKARRRANELGAKTAVQAALDVGSRTHLKLERECDRVLQTLSSTQSNEESLE